MAKKTETETKETREVELTALERFFVVAVINEQRCPLSEMARWIDIANKVNFSSDEQVRIEGRDLATRATDRLIPPKAIRFTPGQFGRTSKAIEAKKDWPVRYASEFLVFGKKFDLGKGDDD